MSRANNAKLEMKAPVSKTGTTPAPVEPLVPSPEVPNPVVGVVVNCTKLNLRAKAVPTADVVTTVDCLSEVTIDEALSTEGFYKVRTATGDEGFCVKGYIALRK